MSALEIVIYLGLAPSLYYYRQELKKLKKLRNQLELEVRRRSEYSIEPSAPSEDSDSEASIRQEEAEVAKRRETRLKQLEAELQLEAEHLTKNDSNRENRIKAIQRSAKS